LNRVLVLRLSQEWETCKPGEHLIWPASEFFLHKLEHTSSKQNSLTSKHIYVDSKSQEVSISS